MNPFLKNFDGLISLLREKNIKYQINDPDSLAPSLEFKKSRVNFKVQLELRDRLDCSIYKEKRRQEVFPIDSDTEISVRKYFEEVFK